MTRTLSLLLALLSITAAALGEEIRSATPVYIKLEAEDFDGFTKDGAWSHRMAWWPHWSRGGDSGWWAVQGDPKATAGEITARITVPQADRYTLWVRYEDYHGQPEPFQVRVQDETLSFGGEDVVKDKDNAFPFAYAWAKRFLELRKGDALVAVGLTQAAPVRRGVDAIILTNDANWGPRDRGFPPFAYASYLDDWMKTREPVPPLVTVESYTIPEAWKPRQTAGRDFWLLLPPRTVEGSPRPSLDYASVGLKVAMSEIKADLLTPDGRLRQRILSDNRPFALVGNYGSAGEVPNSYADLKQTFGERWVGVVAGENSYLGRPWLPVDPPAMEAFKEANYRYLLDAGRADWRAAMEADWATAPIANPFEKLILSQAVTSMQQVHRMAEAGSAVIGIETAAASPYVSVHAAFGRGAARQYGRRWSWYLWPAFGDAMRSFTKDPPYVLELEGLKVDNRNETVGLSLAHLRRVLLQSYFGGANFFYPGDGPGIYNEDGSLHPMGWPYDEVARLAARHPDRGVPYTPVAVLLDRAHGWEKYTYAGQRIWDTKPLEPGDRMIDAFFNVAFYPFPRNEGEPANDLNVPFPHGVFGDIFDVLVTSPTHMDAIDAYPVLICVGDTRLDAAWGERLKRYVERGGTLVINAKQVTPESGLDPAFLGAGQARCPDREANGVVTDAGEELWGTPFGYACWMANGATVIARTPDGNAIAFLHEVGRGRVIVTTPRYLLGVDGQPLPYFAHLLRRLTGGLMPVEVRGDVQHSINLRDDGYVILLNNNAGITKLSHSPAVMDASQTRPITLRVREKPLATEEWIGEDPRDWVYPNEWLREYTQPIEVTWKPHGDIYVAELTLQPGETRAVFLRMR